MTRSEYWKDYAQRLGKLERKYAPKVYKALVEQLRIFTSGLRQGRTDIVLWNEGIGRVLRQMHVEGAWREGKYTLRRLNDGIEVKRLGTSDEWAAEIIRLLQEHNARFVLAITETTREYLIDQLRQGVADGMSYNEIADRLDSEVRQIYANRSFAIARTELGRAMNLGNVMAANRYEFETQKVWITAHDHRVRGVAKVDGFSHVELDGDVAEMNEPFSNGEQLMQPGDPKASPGNTINCRCTIAIRGKRDANGGQAPGGCIGV